MKKRIHQSRVALLGKRKKFSTVFLTEWVTSLLVMTLVFILVLNISLTYIRSDIESNFLFTENATIDYISETYNTIFNEHSEYPEASQEVQFRNRIQFRLAANSMMPYYTGMLYDSTTGEVIADSDRHAFIFYRTEKEGVTHCAICPEEVLTELLEFQNEYMYDLITYNNYMVEMNVDTIYMKDGIFYPGEVEAYIYPMDETEALIETNPENIVASETFDFTPENVENYVKYDTDSFPTFLGPVIAGAGDMGQYFIPESVAIAQERLHGTRDPETGLVNISEETYTYQFTSFFTLGVASETEIAPSGSNEAYILRSVAYVDLWEMLGVYIIISAVITFIFTVLYALVRTRLVYTRLKAQYDLDDYRKTLMNTMAHDLKSPLMSISGYAENLKEQIHSEKREHYAEAILENVQHMNTIINDILSLSKTESGNIALDKKELNIADIFTDCLKQYELQIKEKNLKTTITGNLTIKADKVLFTQALDNLVCNAIKHSDKNAFIAITLSSKNIRISNPYEKDLTSKVNSLCNPFVVGDEDRSDKNGSGLGLAIVKNIVTMHGYDFELDYKNKMFNATIKM